MPNFLSWGMNQEKQFGAYVQLNASTFKPQPDGRVLVEKTPRTEFFDNAKISRLVEAAGPNTKPFWEQMAQVFPTQQALFENSRDIDAAQSKATPDLGHNLVNKPSFSV